MGAGVLLGLKFVKLEILSTSFIDLGPFFLKQFILDKV